MKNLLGKKWLKIIIFTLVIFIFGFWFFNDIKRNFETYEAEYPIIKMERNKEWLSVEYSTESHISDFVDLSIFQGLYPNLDREERLAILGEPFDTSSEYTKEDGGSNIDTIEYRMPYGKVIFINGFINYDGGRYTSFVELMRMYPNNVRTNKILSSQIIDAIGYNKEIKKVSIKESGDRTNITIFLNGDKIDYISWDWTD